MPLRNQIKRVKFGDDWVDLKKLSVGELREMKATASEVEPLPGEELLEAQGYAFLMAALRAAIVAWSDEDPVTPDTIAELPADITLKLQDEIGLGDREVPLPDGSSSTDS